MGRATFSGLNELKIIRLTNANISSFQSDSLPSGSAPVVESIPVEPPSYISIQTNGFLPIFPSLPDPLAPTDCWKNQARLPLRFHEILVQ